MPFHRSFFWLVLLSVLLTLVVVLGLDSLGCIAVLNTRRLSDFSRAVGDDSEELVRLFEDSEKSGHGHVQHVAVDRVSADQLNVSFVESLVPTLAKLSEEAWANAPVPYGLLYFVEIRTTKLISLAQLIRADPSLTSDSRRRLMQRLVVNYHAVTRVGDKLCGAIDDYVDRVATRTVAAKVEGNPDGAECELQPAHDSHDVQDLFLLPQYREALEDAKDAVLEDLVARNPGWREAVRVCRLLNVKMEHFLPIINSLLNSGVANLL